MQHNIYFVSGIDTDAGKSYCTAWLARRLMSQGKRVITQKFIQTGNSGRSEDIELHRSIMGCGMLPEDRDFTTAPEIFSYPASPLLASKIDKRPVDFEKINNATKRLADKYDVVEGAGGLMVPLTEDLLTIDYIARKGYPLIFVTGGRLGSINHTLLSLEAISRRGIALHTVLYNLYPDSSDKVLRDDTWEYLKRHLTRHYPHAQLMQVPVWKEEECQPKSVPVRTAKPHIRIQPSVGILHQLKEEYGTAVSYAGVKEERRYLPDIGRRTLRHLSHADRHEKAVLSASVRRT